MGERDSQIGPQDIIARVFGEVKQAKQDRIDQEEKDREIREKSQQLHLRAMEIVHDHGEEESITVGTGAGPGIIGARLEYTTRKITPAVQFELGEDDTTREVVDVRISEELQGASNYQIEPRGYAIGAVRTDPETGKPTKQTLYLLKGDRIEDWRGACVSEDQFSHVDTLLTHIDQSLSADLEN